MKTTKDNVGIEVGSNVSHPPHYLAGGIEVIDYIHAKLGHEGFIAYCMGNVLKYTSRWNLKNGVEDLEKAKVYLTWVIEERKNSKYTAKQDLDYG